MAQSPQLTIDTIGYWSEIKLDIVRDYAKAYSTNVAAQSNPSFEHFYIDAFAGAGIHTSKRTGEEVDGSPRIAVATEPPFRQCHFIDRDGSRVENLRSMFAGNPSVHVHHGDCNDLMLNQILPEVRYEDYRRTLCLLDPYGLHLDWRVIQTAGKQRTIDMFLNFPVADMNRNVFWRHPEGVDLADIARMNRFWGDESWRNVAYKTDNTLFGPVDVRTDNETVAEAFRLRLQQEAGFAWVPEPMPMRNSKGAIVYSLFFASAKKVAVKIVDHIFAKYRNHGAI